MEATDTVMLKHDVNGFGKPKKPGPTAYNCARRHRPRQKPSRPPKENLMTRASAWLIPPPKVRASLETASSNNDQLMMKFFGITVVGVEVIR